MCLGNVVYEMQSMKCDNRMRYTKCGIQNAIYRIQYTECDIQNAVCEMRSTKCDIQNAIYTMINNDRQRDRLLSKMTFDR